MKKVTIAIIVLMVLVFTVTVGNVMAHDGSVGYSSNWNWWGFLNNLVSQYSAKQPANFVEETYSEDKTHVSVTSGQELNIDEQQMVDLVNAERVERGLNPLKVDMRLVKLARTKARDMIVNNYFDHQSPTLGSPFDQMRAVGIDYAHAGENLAESSTVERAHAGLMNSPGHRANILHDRYTHIGIGVVDGAPYGKMFVQHFIQVWE